jgi:hypothetical protein
MADKRTFAALTTAGIAAIGMSVMAFASPKSDPTVIPASAVVDTAAPIWTADMKWDEPIPVKQAAVYREQQPKKMWLHRKPADDNQRRAAANAAAGQLQRALRDLQSAKASLWNAHWDYAHHRAAAFHLTDRAIREVQAALAGTRR